MTPLCLILALLMALSCGTQQFPLKSVFSAEFAMRTSLSHVLSPHVETLLPIVLLLIDDAGEMHPNASSSAAGLLLENPKWGDELSLVHLKDHTDFGFLPRVSSELFSRYWNYAATRAIDYGNNRWALFPFPLTDSNDWEAVYNAEQETFLIRKKATTRWGF